MTSRVVLITFMTLPLLIASVDTSAQRLANRLVRIQSSAVYDGCVAQVYGRNSYNDTVSGVFWSGYESLCIALDTMFIDTSLSQSNFGSGRSVYFELDTAKRLLRNFSLSDHEIHQIETGAPTALDLEVDFSLNFDSIPLQDSFGHLIAHRVSPGTADFQSYPLSLAVGHTWISGGGCVDTEKITDTLLVDMTPVNLGVSLFPNDETPTVAMSAFPAIANSYVKVREISPRSVSGNLTVFNLLGEAIASRKVEIDAGDNTEYFETSGWTSSTYIARLSADGKVSTTRFIVQH